MKLYVDSSNLKEIEELCELGLVDGVTTNPSLIAKEKKDFKKQIENILDILKKYAPKDFTLSCEVTETELSSMLEQAISFSKIHKNIIVKIPLTKQGLLAVKILSKKKIRCNVTLCFSANQALLAAKSGAFCVSPFIGRLENIGHNGIELISDIKEIYQKFNFPTKILGASIHTCEHIFNCAKLGCDIVTIPPNLFHKLYLNPLTDLGIEEFENDWKAYKKNNF